MNGSDWYLSNKACNSYSTSLKTEGSREIEARLEVYINEGSNKYMCQCSFQRGVCVRRAATGLGRMEEYDSLLVGRQALAQRH